MAGIHNANGGSVPLGLRLELPAVSRKKSRD